MPYLFFNVAVAVALGWLIWTGGGPAEPAGPACAENGISSSAMPVAETEAPSVGAPAEAAASLERSALPETSALPLVAAAAPASDASPRTAPVPSAQSLMAPAVEVPVRPVHVAPVPGTGDVPGTGAGGIDRSPRGAFQSPLSTGAGDDSRVDPVSPRGARALYDDLRRLAEDLELDHLRRAGD